MTFAYDCDSTTTYAFHCSASKVDLFNTNGNYACSDTMFISKYDFKTNTFTPVCFIKMPDQIWYAWVTSPDEFLAGDPECDLLLDLDRDNSSGLYPYDYRLNKTLCTESSTMISDSDIYLHTSIPLDSVILVVHGILDPGLEILTYNNTIPGLSLRKINDSTYILKGPRNTPDSSYRAALLAIRYEHLTGNRTSGTRRIELQGFSVVKAGVKVSAFINLGSIPNSGIDTTITICSHKKITGLSKMIHGAPGGKWIPGLTGGDDYDSALDLANEYTYITGDTICGMDTAIVTIKRGIGTTPMNLTIDTVLCKGNSFVFGGTTYKDTGKFVSIVRSIQGCDSIIYNLQIKSSNILPIDSKQDKALCAGDTITLSVDPIYQQITWIRGVIALGTQPNIRTSSAGEYIVSGIDKNQCKSTDTILVRLFTKPGINVEDMLGLEFINDRPISINYSGNPVKYTWTPPAGLSCANCAVPNLVDDQDRKYKIEVNNAQNCKANDSLLVTYLRANYFMPNAIKIQTQNIGNNNKFFIQGNVAGSYDLQIFNRWGSVVFTTKDLLINDPSSGWLPSETGSPPGVYVYKVILHTVNGDVLKAGDVTVLD
ncbi:MAG: hypothetical protein ABI761_17055 [Saprospiraceae bacterium]